MVLHLVTVSFFRFAMIYLSLSFFASDGAAVAFRQRRLNQGEEGIGKQQ